jgi:hypothetical protein
MSNYRPRNNYYYDAVKVNQNSRKIRELEIENKNLKDELKTIKNEKQYLDSQYEMLLKEKKQLEIEKASLSQILEKKNKNLDCINEKYNEKTKLLRDKEFDMSSMKKNYDKDMKSMKKEVEDTHNKFDIAIKHYDKMDKTIESQNKTIKELKEKNKGYIEKEKENNQLLRRIKQEEPNENFLNKAAEEYYDVVIDINSINTLKNDCWEIKYNKERENIYNEIVGEQTIKIGVLGLNNVGKSYLLSKIVNIEIPSGYSVETKGISIKYSEGKKGEEESICILDSAGFETPLLRNRNDDTKKNEKKDDELKNSINNEVENIIKIDPEEELSRDKAQTERFIEQLIISLSDLIILVVGKLTRTEQRLINRIKNLSKYNEKNKIKFIFIVHNLAQYHKIIEVQRHINNYLLLSASFNLESRKVIGIKEYKDREYFYEKFDDIDIFHFIMAKEGTEAGNYYNNLTIELIKHQYNNCNQRKKIDIPEEIIKLFSEMSNEITGEQIDLIKSEQDKNKIILKNKNIENIKEQSFNINSAYMDQDGNYLKNKGKFEPKYSLFLYKEKKKNDDDDDDEEIDEKYLLLRIEAPGNIKSLTARSTDPKKEKYSGIVIKGFKERDEFTEKNSENLKIIDDNREYGQFTYFIELKRNLQLSKKEAKGKTQIYEILFDNRNKEKFFENIEETNTKPINKLANKEVEAKKIASGVYVMKFSLTENSFF